MNALLTLQADGAGYALLCFVLIFLVVHLVKLARYGFDFLKKPPPDEPKPEPPPSPVYYHFERKKVKRKPKTEYAPPKKIHFDED